MDGSFSLELNLFLEDICYDLFRFREAHVRGVHQADVPMRQEVFLANGPGYADLEIPHADGPQYVEIKWGRDVDHVAESLRRKYRSLPAADQSPVTVAVVTDLGDEDWARITEAAGDSQGSRLVLDRLDRASLSGLVEEYFGVPLPAVDVDSLLKVRAAIEKAKGLLAFGEDYHRSLLQDTALWHVGHWMVQMAREENRLEQLLAPGLYPGVAVVIADISGFSSYVRDTPDDSVIRYILTSFYTKARRQVLASGGMISQFVGDSVIALFGLHHCPPDYMCRALECAQSLLDIGCSISNSWQRMIDRLQHAAGCHVGIAVGDLHLLPLRAFSRSHLGVIADSVNMAARLSSVAGPHEIVVSNAFHSKLPVASQKLFVEMAPVEAKNMGLLRAWKSTAPRQ